MTGEARFRPLEPDESFDGKDLVVGFGPLSGDPQVEAEFQQWRESYLKEEAAEPRPACPIDPYTMTTDEEVALAMADLYDEGPGHMPTYAEEALEDALRRRSEGDSTGNDTGNPN